MPCLCFTHLYSLLLHGSPSKCIDSQQEHLIISLDSGDWWAFLRFLSPGFLSNMASGHRLRWRQPSCSHSLSPGCFCGMVAWGLPRATVPNKIPSSATSHSMSKSSPESSVKKQFSPLVYERPRYPTEELCVGTELSTMSGTAQHLHLGSCSHRDQTHLFPRFLWVKAYPRFLEVSFP